jgi:flagellar basal-body rod protein FlgG
MSVQTLYTAATGMDALETKLDVIANNMANINTTAFKKDRANFEDLFYRQLRLPGALDSDGNYTSTGVEVGLGTRVSSTQTNHGQGAMQTTNNPLDFAVEGKGFFKVQNPQGGSLYTRAGNFGINPNQQLVLGSAQTGWILDPNISIPPEATGVVVTADGQVQYSTAGTTTLQNAGQIQLSTFLNPDGLLKIGDNLFQQTDASGQATDGTPGQNGAGVIRQGALEASNVEPVQELIDLITTQRAFELNSQVVQAGDQVMQVAANLRRV